MISFIRNLVGVKTDRAVQAGVEALVRWDPQSATEAGRPAPSQARRGADTVDEGASGHSGSPDAEPMPAF